MILPSNLSDPAKTTLSLAFDEALQLGEVVNTYCLLLALLQQTETIACKALNQHGITHELISGTLQEPIRVVNSQPQSFAPNIAQVMRYADGQARTHGCEFIEPHHILLGILCEANNRAADTIIRFAALHMVRHTVYQLMQPCGGQEPTLLLTIDGIEVQMTDELKTLIKNTAWSNCGVLSTKKLLAQFTEGLE